MTPENPQPIDLDIISAAICVDVIPHRYDEHTLYRFGYYDDDIEIDGLAHIYGHWITRGDGIEEPRTSRFIGRGAEIESISVEVAALDGTHSPLPPDDAEKIRARLEKDLDHHIQTMIYYTN